MFLAHIPGSIFCGRAILFSRSACVIFMLSGANPAARSSRDICDQLAGGGRHGGFYQALAEGTYAKYGLDVTILQGGPQATPLLLAAGGIDFDMGAT